MSSLNTFTVGAIYATASVTSNGFHYTLSLMLDANTAKKLHAKEVSKDHFIFESMNKSIQQSNTLCVALQVGNMGTHTASSIITLLETIPMVLPESDVQTDKRFRCRVWLKQALRVLNQTGIISCPDADKVVNGELKVLAKDNSDHVTQGTGNSDHVTQGTGTYKVHVSQYSA